MMRLYIEDTLVVILAYFVFGGLILLAAFLEFIDYHPKWLQKIFDDM